MMLPQTKILEGRPTIRERSFKYFSKERCPKSSTIPFEKYLENTFPAMWETTFPRNTHAGFCKDFTKVAYTAFGN